MQVKGVTQRKEAGLDAFCFIRKCHGDVDRGVNFCLNNK